MQDPEVAGAWLNLPLLMNMHADKTFAQYQLEVFEARKLVEKGQVKPSKFESAKANSRRPLILMHSSGEPASNKYIKDHLVKDDDGQLRLKAHMGMIKISMGTLKLFQIEDIVLWIFFGIKRCSTPCVLQ